MSTVALSVFIRSVGVHAPERRLTNDDLSKLVDTNDEVANLPTRYFKMWRHIATNLPLADETKEFVAKRLI